MVLAKDIMQKRVQKINKEGTIANAVELMKEKNTEIVFVVDKKREYQQSVLGVLTPKLVKAYETKVSKDKTISNRVKNFMSEKFDYVFENTNMLEVLDIMSSKGFKSIPVMNEEKEIVGLITPTSLLTVISEITPGSDKEVIEIE
jgi:osmoprotectant transport system ATP-binding protein